MRVRGIPMGFLPVLIRVAFDGLKLTRYLQIMAQIH